MSANGDGQSDSDNFNNTTLNVTVTGGSTAPCLAQAPTASPPVTTAATSQLSVLATDDGGEATLTYTWAGAAGNPGSVSFNPNGTNAAKNTVVTFTAPGQHTLTVTILDGQNQTATANVNVTATSTFTFVDVQPASTFVEVRRTKQFTANGLDQFRLPTPLPGAIIWEVFSGGTITQSGLFTAGPNPGGPHAISARTNGVTGGASVTLVPVGQLPADTTPPTVTLTAPAAGAVLTGVVTVKATATDDDSVASVSLVVDSTSVGSPKSAPPYELSLDTATLRDGAHTLEVVARDPANNAGKSGAITVTTQNGNTGSGGGGGSSTDVGGGCACTSAAGLMSPAFLLLLLSLARRRSRQP